MKCAPERCNGPILVVLPIHQAYYWPNTITSVTYLGLCWLRSPRLKIRSNLGFLLKNADLSTAKESHEQVAVRL